MNRSIVWMDSAAGLAVGLIGAYLFYLIPTRLVPKGELFTAVGLPLVFFAAVAACLAAMAFLTASKKLPGADTLRIGPKGVELWLGPTLQKDWRWESPSDHFVLSDCTMSPSFGKLDHPFYFINNSGFWSRDNALTKDVFDAILAAAEQNGARVRRHAGSPRAPYPVTLYDVVGGEPK